MPKGGFSRQSLAFLLIVALSDPVPFQSHVRSDISVKFAPQSIRNRFTYDFYLINITWKSPVIPHK